MKTFLLALLFSSNVMAASCEDIANLSKTIETKRQEGVTLVQMMSVEGINQVKFIVLEAYKEPMMMGKEGKERVIDEFQNKIYGECLKVQEKLNETNH